MGRIGDLFKKIRAIKGMFHARMGIIKNRNCKDIIEAEEIKQRWHKHTEQLYIKGLHNPDRA